MQKLDFDSYIETVREQARAIDTVSGTTRVMVAHTLGLHPDDYAFVEGTTQAPNGSHLIRVYGTQEGQINDEQVPGPGLQAGDIEGRSKIPGYNEPSQIIKRGPYVIVRPVGLGLEEADTKLLGSKGQNGVRPVSVFISPQINNGNSSAEVTLDVLGTQQKNGTKFPDRVPLHALSDRGQLIVAEASANETEKFVNSLRRFASGLQKRSIVYGGPSRRSNKATYF